MRLGLIGLGKMGSRIVLKLLKEGHTVVVWNRSSKASEELELKVQNAKFKITSQKLKISKTIGELVGSLEKPRVVWLMLPAGKATQTVFDEVSRFVEKEDIVIDGGNAYYKDTEDRYRKLKKIGVRFLGIGVSGGILAAKNGYPLMVGGDKSAYQHILPILSSLAKPNGGHAYFGEGGAGHFVKMVHNGIEYGMMQSLGEGFGVLQKSAYRLDLLEVSKLWQKGTIVSGFLLDRVFDALGNDPTLSKIKGYIEESGEAKWTVEEAKKQGVPIEIIEKSLAFRRQSQKDPVIQDSFAAKLVASLRNAFGGHRLLKDGF